MTIRQARSRVQRLKAEIVRDTKSAVGRAIKSGEREAKRMSSGPVTPAQSAAKDYIYARRHGPLGLVQYMPQKSRAVINEQTGQFKASWYADAPQSQDRTVSARLSNQNEVADFLQYGTEFMVRRPINVYLTDFINNAALKELQIMTSRLERFYS